ncbi:MAG: adenylate kinase [Mariprofundaceae bacterium]
MRLVLFGPPGVGKGTQSKRLAEEFGLIHIAAGDILREIVGVGTRLGDEARRYMEAGQLVPDDVVTGLIGERITSNDAENGFVLDGFPRNLAQATSLSEILERSDANLDRVVFLDAGPEALIERLSGRLTCRACDFGFHRHYSPPRVEGCCDRCNGELYQRDDDREDVIAVRLQTYSRQTKPLLGYYSDHPGFRSVNAEDALDNVYNNLKKVLTD